MVLPRIESASDPPYLQTMPGGAEREKRNVSLTRSLRYPGETKGTWRDRIRDFFSAGRKRHRSEEARRSLKVGRNVAAERSKSWGPDVMLRMERDVRAGKAVSTSLEGAQLEKERQRSSVGGAHAKQPRPLFMPHGMHTRSMLTVP